ncbi:Ribonuclease inhibitor [Hondaea fermentalgiana]|uniref:Ribonuclease inhibitor n=1 Tax=Hondaea fermentalgiana TaxID=2315210 RepID=A0A2R5GW07_9STRA|nr:Ribonuclease inhibitor [Hondaea fermentalgiana]|eukprot:GBG32114.1 Ribonuclease inhibitor [Hondaea fermentalgiana]
MALVAAFVEQCETARVEPPRIVTARLREAEAAPHVLNLNKVKMTSSCVRLVLDTLRALPRAGLREIDLSYIKIGEHGARFLAGLLRDPRSQVVKLSLRHCALGDAGAALLCQNLGHLQALDISDNCASRETASALAIFLGTHPDCPLWSLTLDRNHLTDMGASLLCKALEGNCNLQHLSMVRCGVAFATASALLSLQKTSLQSLAVRHNAISTAKFDELRAKFRAEWTNETPPSSRANEQTKEPFLLQEANAETPNGFVLEPTVIFQQVLRDLQHRVSLEPSRARDPPSQVELGRLVAILRRHAHTEASSAKEKSLVLQSAQALSACMAAMERMNRVTNMYKSTSSRIVASNAALAHLLTRDQDENTSSIDIVNTARLINDLERTVEGQAARIETLEADLAHDARAAALAQLQEEVAGQKLANAEEARLHRLKQRRLKDENLVLQRRIQELEEDIVRAEVAHADSSFAVGDFGPPLALSDESDSDSLSSGSEADGEASTSTFSSRSSSRSSCSGVKRTPGSIDDDNRETVSESSDGSVDVDAHPLRFVGREGAFDDGDVQEDSEEDDSEEEENDEHEPHSTHLQNEEEFDDDDDDSMADDDNEVEGADIEEEEEETKVTGEISSTRTRKGSWKMERAHLMLEVQRAQASAQRALQRADFRGEIVQRLQTQIEDLVNENQAKDEILERVQSSLRVMVDQQETKLH